MKKIEFKVLNKIGNKDLLKDGSVTALGHSMIKEAKLCELQLQSDSYYISLFVSKETYKKIKDDTKIIVEVDGFWTSLSDDGVVVKRENGDVITPIETY